MRVLHVIPGIAERYGGPSRAVSAMCRALGARGLETLIVTTDADGAGRLPVEVGHPLRYQEVPTIFFPRRFSESFKYSPPLAAWVDRNVGAFDVVHIHAVFSHACLAAARACRRLGIPYVVRPLGTLDPWSLGQKRFRKRVLWHGGAAKMLRHAAAVQYTTSQERRLAEETLGLGRGVVIPLGVDEQLLGTRTALAGLRRRYPALGSAPYVLALSRLHPKKGIDLLLEVFLECTRQPDLARWRLVVAGEGDDGYLARLQRLTQARDGEARVLFTGWLDGADKVEALQGAGLFALPSRQENFGLSVVEALACGTPVLISVHVNLADDIRAAGAGWVTPLEPRAIGEALVAALRDDGERARRGAAGRDLVTRRFRWSAVAAELSTLYESVARSAARDGSPHRRRSGARRGQEAVVAAGGARVPSGGGAVPLSVLVLTYDEEQNLPPCLDSVAGWAREILIVDSGSTDRTVAIAEHHGAQVFTHPFESHAKQWNWALQNLPISGEWVFGLDADQRVTPELRDEIARLIGRSGAAGAGPVGYFVNRRQIFRGRWIRHGGYYPKYLLKLFRRGEAWADEDDLVDHHFRVKGRTEKLRFDIVEDNRNEADISTWVAKHNRYAALQARDEIRRPYGQGASLFGSPDERTRWLKNVWSRLPLYVRPFLYFFYRYALRLGFLDGKEGFIFHFLQAFWYRLLVDIKIDELRGRSTPGEG